MTPFLAVQPTESNQFRALMLFGRNVASYKFALGRSLLDLSAHGIDLISLEDLAVPYSRYLREHLARAPKQATSRSSRFLEVCRRANLGEASEDDVQTATMSLGFNNVIDAFHRLGPTDIDCHFFVDERRSTGGVRLTEALYRLADASAELDLGQETEARWRLVEKAWELGVSDTLISFDRDSEDLVTGPRERRVSITSSRAALNGYQKGRCFYCFAPIALDQSNADSADVDHVFPWSLRKLLWGNIDGVWSLVLACRRCNRGAGGKSDCVPHVTLVERLHRRNEFLITSHHPLRETLMAQTGVAEPLRAGFLASNYEVARHARVAEWRAAAVAEAAF